jgi:lipopolysaccharide export system protein LptA
VRLTIEWLRTLVVAAGVLLVVALAVFLTLAKFRNPLNLKEMPKRLGIDIQQEANGVTYSHALGAHSQFKIHASKAEQLKNGRILLHDVRIELYGQDGKRLDSIQGNEFDYDEKNGTATAAGPVEITLMRPALALTPAIPPKATPGHALGGMTATGPLASAAATAASGEIHVETSGLTSNWNTGVTTTGKRVDFTMTQGAGSAMGASYDSQRGILVLDRDVELTTQRAGETVRIHARHAEFARDDLQCNLQEATADYRDGQATAAETKILFREDGSAVQLDATGGFTATTAAGGHLAAPTASVYFNDHNQPSHAHLAGGVRIDSHSQNRQFQATSPTTDLEFTKYGELHLAHLERGVEMSSLAVSKAAVNPKTGIGAAMVRTSRTWRSPMADVEFRDAGHGQVEPAKIHGTGGVVVTSESQSGKAAPVPSRLAADVLNAEFGPDSALTAMTGMGHASIAETTATGAAQTASGDRLEAHFAPGNGAGTGGLSGAEAQVQSAALDGHVVLVEESPAKPGAKAEPPLHATAGRAVYEGAGQWLHLTLSPRVEDGDLQLTAHRIDVSQESGDAFARGDVKVSWFDNSKGANSQPPRNTAGQGSMSLGGQGPAHAIAQEVQLHRATDEATFTGHARLWQQANSIAAPVIVLNRQKKALVARSADPTEPVRVVLLSAESLEPGSASGKESGGRYTPPSVIRVQGSELVYSDVERKAVMVGGSLGEVVAETGSATSASNRVELFLEPAGNRSGMEGARGQVERMTASGHVVVTSQGRRGSGEQLAYTSRTGEYVLTGTAAKPPRITDPARGTVTGKALIFHSRDDSVSIEGGGHETTTETTVRQINGRSEPKR